MTSPRPSPSADPRLKQYTFAQALELLGYKSRESIYNLVKDGYLEKINPRPHVARITGSSLMDYIEATNAGKQPVAKYTPKKAGKATPAGVVSKQEAVPTRAKSVLEWMGIKR